MRARSRRRLSGKLMRKLSAAAIAILLLACRPLFAAGPGTSAVAALKMDGSARAMAMGGAFTAVADDASSVFYNPAGLAQAQRAELSLTHTEWLAGVRSEYGALALPAGKKLTFGAGANFLFTDQIPKTDANGINIGSFGSNEGYAVLSAAVNLGRVALGASGKYVRQAVDDKSASAVAGDFGALVSIGDLRLGAAVQNAGSQITLATDAFPLPLTESLGASWRIFSPLLLAAEYRKPSDETGALHAGFEYSTEGTGSGDRLFLRGGYVSGRQSDTGPGLSAGLGVELSDWRIDYGFMPWGDLGNAHRLTLSMRFGKSRAEKRFEFPAARQPRETKDPRPLPDKEYPMDADIYLDPEKAAQSSAPQPSPVQSVSPQPAPAQLVTVEQSPAQPNPGQPARPAPEKPVKKQTPPASDYQLY